MAPSGYKWDGGILRAPNTVLELDIHFHNLLFLRQYLISLFQSVFISPKSIFHFGAAADFNWFCKLYISGEMALINSLPLIKYWHDMSGAPAGYKLNNE